MTGRRLTPEQLDAAHRLLVDRVGYGEAARVIGCHPTTLRARFPGMGLAPGGQRGRVARNAITAEQLDAAHRLLVDRAGYHEAARTVGCCRRSLQHYFPGMGLTDDEIRERVGLVQKARHLKVSA